MFKNLLFVAALSVGALTASTAQTVDGIINPAEGYTNLAVKANANSCFGAAADITAIRVRSNPTTQKVYIGVVCKLPTGSSDGLALWLNFSQGTGRAAGTPLAIAPVFGAHYMEGNNAANPNFKSSMEVDYMFALHTSGTVADAYVNVVKHVGTSVFDYFNNLGQTGAVAVNNTSGGLFANAKMAFNNTAGLNTGLEMEIPYGDLGITAAGTVQAFAVIVSQNAYFSNVTVPGNYPASAGCVAFDADFSTANGGPYNSAARPLPVTLLSFEAKQTANDALLYWSTASELNSASFEIEHSIDSKNWVNVGSVRANGNTSEVSNYEFTHKSINGTNYYRLTSVDVDGTSNVIGVRTIKVKNNTLSVYPNPTSDVVSILGVEGLSTVSLIDAKGSVMLSKQVDAQNNTIGLSNLTNGVYVIKVQSNASVSVMRLVINK